MTGPNYSEITDTSRPRPVRYAAFGAALAQAVLAVLAIALKMDPVLVGSLLGVITIASLGGWLFVEQKVTPTSSPATTTSAGNLVALVKAGSTPPPGL
jgi:hypothetical protein